MLDDFNRRFIHEYLVVWYKPTKKTCYCEIDHIYPRFQIGYKNGFGHEVVAIIDLAEIFFRERYRFRKKIYRICFRFFQTKMKKINEKEKKKNDRYTYHS